MRSYQAGELLLTETATSAGTTSERAVALLEILRRVVPFDGAFLAFADPLGHGYHSLTAVDLDASTVDFLSGPQVARDIEATGTDRARPPLGPSDLPYPAAPGGHVRVTVLAAPEDEPPGRSTVPARPAAARPSTRPSSPLEETL